MAESLPLPSLEDADDLIYGFDKEGLEKFMRQTTASMLKVLLERLPEKGIKEETFINLLKTHPWKNSRKQPTVSDGASTNVEPPPPSPSPPKNIKQEKISTVVRPTDADPMPPPKMPAPRSRKIKTEAPDQPQTSTGARTRTKIKKEKESVIPVLPDVPLVDLTNSVSPRRTRSKIRKVATQVDEKNNLDEIPKNTTPEKNEVVQPTSKLNSKSEQQVNANSPPEDDADNSKRAKRTHTVKELDNPQPLDSSKTNSSEVLGKTRRSIPDDSNKLFAQADLNQTYTLPSESQSTNTSVAKKQPPSETTAPTKSKKPITPLKSSKSQIPQRNFKSPATTTTPNNKYKPQKVFKAEEKKGKVQESLREIELQKMKKEAQMKLEAANKLMEKKKAEELLKKKQELKLKAKFAKAGSSKTMGKDPIYMTQKPPLLPSLDCYDSDEEYKQEPNLQYPTWTQSKSLAREELVGHTTGVECLNTLFLMRVATPDLREIFESIDAKKLIRSSSAHWKKPPRYTLCEEHSSIIFSEDED